MSAIQRQTVSENRLKVNKSEACSSEKLSKPVRKWIKIVITQACIKEMPDSSFWRDATVVSHFKTLDCSRSDRNEQLLKQIEGVVAILKSDPKFDFLNEVAGYLSVQQQNFLRAVKDVKATRFFSYSKFCYNINDPVQRFEIAKIAAAQNGGGTSEYIKDYGIENKEHLYEIAKIAAAQCGWETSKYIKNYGLEDQDQLYEIAKIAAAQSGWGTSKHIKDYGIENQEYLYEIAKIAVTVDGENTSLCIQNYGIENQDHLYEIAKIVALQSGSGISYCIKDFGIENQEHLYEIAKIAAAENGGKVSENIKDYGIENKEHLYEIAKIAAAENARETSKNIKEYGIENQDYLYEIAKIAAAESSIGISEYIKDYGIESKDHLYEIAKIAAEQSGMEISEYIKNYGIESKENLFEIAKIVSAQSGWGISKNIKDYSIEKQEYLYEIAKIAAAQDGRATSIYIKNYGIKNKEHLYEIAKIAAVQDGWAISEHIKNYGMENKEHLYEIAKIAAAQNGRATSKYIKGYGIEDKEHLYEIAKAAAAQNGMGTSIYINNYGVKNKDHLYEVAKIAAAQNGEETSMYIKNYGIENTEHLFKIAKIAAAQNGWGISVYIKNYGIENQEFLYEIAKIAAAEDGGRTSENIKKYGIENKEYLFEIAKIAAAHEGWTLFNAFTYYQLEEEEQAFIKFILSLYNPDRFGPLHSKTEKYMRGELSHPERHLQEAIEKLNDCSSDYIREKQMEWLKLILDGYSYIETFKTHYVKIAPLIKRLMEYRDPIKRRLFTISLLHRIFIEKDADAIVSFVNTAQKFSSRHAITAMLYFALIETPKTDWYRGIIQKLLINKKCCSEKPWVRSINNGLFALLSCKFLNSDEKHQLLDMIIKMEVPRSKRKKAVRKAMLAIESLVTIGKHDKIKQFLADNKEGASSTASSSSSSFGTTSKFTSQQLFDGLNRIFESVFHEEFSVEGVQDMSRKYRKTFGKFRNQAAVFSYNASLKRLPSSDRGSALEAYRFYIRGVLNSTFEEERYDVNRNPHLKVIFADRETLRDEWMKGAALTRSANSHTSAPQQVNLYAFFEQKIKTDSHLGEGWKKRYPHISGIFSGNKVPFEKLIDTIAKKIEKEESQNSRQALHVEHCLLKLLQSEERENPLASNGALLAKLRDNLGDVELKNDVDALIQSLAKKRECGEYTVVDTDDHQDLLLCGTEVNGSCQRVNGDPSYNRGLLGYLLNGQTRMVAVKDPQGRIVGRCLLRLLWDKKSRSPALYRERFYINSDQARVKALLVEMCEMRAQSLELPLHSSESKSTGKTFASLGGPAPFEYVDATGGVTSGEYTINV